MSVPLVDALQTRLEGRILLRRPWSLPECAPVDKHPNVSDALLLKPAPLLLEVADDQLEGLTVRVGMCWGAPIVREHNDREGAIPNMAQREAVLRRLVIL